MLLFEGGVGDEESRIFLKMRKARFCFEKFPLLRFRYRPGAAEILTGCCGLEGNLMAESPQAPDQIASEALRVQAVEVASRGVKCGAVGS
jgi:hypothetical protein